MPGILKNEKRSDEDQNSDPESSGDNDFIGYYLRPRLLPEIRNPVQNGERRQTPRGGRHDYGSRNSSHSNTTSSDFESNSLDENSVHLRQPSPFRLLAEAVQNGWPRQVAPRGRPFHGNRNSHSNTTSSDSESNSSDGNSLQLRQPSPLRRQVMEAVQNEGPRQVARRGRPFHGNRNSHSNTTSSDSESNSSDGNSLQLRQPSPLRRQVEAVQNEGPRQVARRGRPFHGNRNSHSNTTSADSESNLPDENSLQLPQRSPLRRQAEAVQNGGWPRQVARRGRPFHGNSRNSIFSEIRRPDTDSNSEENHQLVREQSPIRPQAAAAAGTAWNRWPRQVARRGRPFHGNRRNSIFSEIRRPDTDSNSEENHQLVREQSPIRPQAAAAAGTAWNRWPRQVARRGRPFHGNRRNSHSDNTSSGSEADLSEENHHVIRRRSPRRPQAGAGAGGRNVQPRRQMARRGHPFRKR